MRTDPLITVQDALALYDGVQARLADALGLKRASVNQWVTEARDGRRKYVPLAQAYRLAALHPELAPRDTPTEQGAVA